MIAPERILATGAAGGDGGIDALLAEEGEVAVDDPGSLAGGIRPDEIRLDPVAEEPTEGALEVGPDLDLERRLGRTDGRTLDEGRARARSR